MEGENSTSGPQPYQPYEAEVTNSPISNRSLRYVQEGRPGMSPVDVPYFPKSDPPPYEADLIADEFMLRKLLWPEQRLGESETGLDTVWRHQFVVWIVPFACQAYIPSEGVFLHKQYDI